MSSVVIAIFLLNIGASFVQRTTGFGIFIMTMLPFFLPTYGEATTLSGLLASGEFNPEEYIEDSVWYDEVPTDEDELFNLWEEWESDQFSSCDVAWALARYPDLPDHMDLEDDQDYICFIPDAFNS